MATKLTLIIFLALVNSDSFAGSNQFMLPKSNIVIFAPPIVNKKYFLFEFGFVSEKSIKSWGYKYNAYATGTLFEDSNRKDSLRGGALGFKGGVMLPTQPWIPLLFTGTFGYAKTALNKNPFFGKDGSSVERKNMIFLEAGALYHYDKAFIRYAYQISNVKYFTKHSILMFGVIY